MFFDIQLLFSIGLIQTAEIIVMCLAGGFLVLLAVLLVMIVTVIVMCVRRKRRHGKSKVACSQQSNG